MLRTSIFFILILLFCDCNTKPETTNAKIAHHETINEDSLNKISALDDTFYSTRVLRGHQAVLKYYFKKHYIDSCPPEMYKKQEVMEGFDGLVYIGDINHNDIEDSVFVLSPLQFPCKSENSEIEDGMSYYFTDTTLPRLITDSYCCHPGNLFLVGDIDEDGISEIGEYYSSCVSRFKSLNVYTLKNHAWTAIGHVTYDLFYADSTKPYSYFVKKIDKKQFKMLEITDLPKDPKFAYKPHWIKFSM